MPVEKAADRIVLNHFKGSSVEILLYGASVISWKAGTKSNPEPTEYLFVSSKAALDGSKPVRGGIPIVFPNFGAPTHPTHLKLGQHGFARSTIWTFDSVVMDNEAGTSVRLTLEPTSSIQAVFDYPFRLAYVVTLAEHQLSTDLYVENTSTSSPFEFQTLFHNYLRAPSNTVLITPLKGLSYLDKTDTSLEGKNQLKTEAREGVDVRKYTDAVYQDAPGQYKVVWPGGGVDVKTKNLKDVVIWNPQENGASIADMEAGGWERYVCVEPGYVRGFVTIQPGAKWSGQQILSLIDSETPSNL